MSEEDESNSNGGMSDHLERYKNYISNLKQGRSSGISAAFGRATDLLPPELFEIKPPKLKNNDEALHGGNAFAGIRAKVSEETHIQDDESGDVEEAADSGHTAIHQADTNDAEPEAAEYGLTEEDSELIEELKQSLESGNPGDFSESELTESDLELEDGDWESSFPELVVDTAFGAPLWNIYYDGPEVRAVLMADGSTIKRAEGRPDFILALKTDSGKTFRLFILDGLIVDPSTGNIYVEANEGAYSAAFLNNGWQLHQYRKHSGEETYFATEPTEIEGVRLTTEVLNLALDIAAGEVSFDTLDGSANMTLKSRVL